jgi:hypothetical protein
MTVVTLFIAAALCVAPLFVRGADGARVFVAFVLVEVVVAASIYSELGSPDSDGPGVIFAGLVPFVLPLVFAASVVVRLACRGIGCAYVAVERRYRARLAQKEAPREPQA